MGNVQYNSSYSNSSRYNKNIPRQLSSIKLSKSLFDFLYVIGRGGFGKVWKVLLKGTSKNYALKEMSKLKIVLKRSEKSIQSERELLSNLYHPFIVNMISAFQDLNNLYLVMDLFKGGDMRYHIFLNKKFNEAQSKFFISNIILGLEYIHKNKIIHRDIKPENLVLDQNGYLAITDFGIAKKIEKTSQPDASGTPGYMAPEVLFSQNHSYSVDYYAVGVIAFEFMKGFRPYQGRDRKEIKEAILAKEIGIGVKTLKIYGWSLEGGDFINKMIKRKVRKRLGYYGIDEIKNHPWFKDVSWTELYLKKIKSPYIPKNGDNFDKKFCEATNDFNNKDINIKKKYNNIIKQKDYFNLFQNYTFLRQEEKEKIFSDFYFENNNNNINNNYGMNKELKKSLSKIIQTNKKRPVKIIDNIYPINDENKNILNYNYNNIVSENRNNNINKSRTMNNFFPSPKNNKNVFHKKRVSSKDSRINGMHKNKSVNKSSNRENRNNNNIFIINPYYNQNINYYQEKDSKENLEINYNNYNPNYKTIDVKNIRLKHNKENNNIFTYKKNLSPRLHSSFSMRAIKSNYDFKRISGHNNNLLNEIDVENIIYSPPHILSPKFKSTRNNNYKNKIEFRTLDYSLGNNNEYNTINCKGYNNSDIEKKMIMNKLGNKTNLSSNNISKINISDMDSMNNNNFFYSTLNKFHNRMACEKMIYSSFNFNNRNNNSISKINHNNYKIALYDNGNSVNNMRQIKNENNNIHTDKNIFNKSRRIKNDIESYCKKNKNYENNDNIKKRRSSKKTVINFYNSNFAENMNNFETINHTSNNNIFKIKVNLIPKPYSKNISVS